MELDVPKCSLPPLRNAAGDIGLATKPAYRLAVADTCDMLIDLVNASGRRG